MAWWDPRTWFSAEAPAEAVRDEVTRSVALGGRLEALSQAAADTAASMADLSETARAALAQFRLRVGHESPLADVSGVVSGPATQVGPLFTGAESTVPQFWHEGPFMGAMRTAIQTSLVPHRVYEPFSQAYDTTHFDVTDDGDEDMRALSLAATGADVTRVPGASLRFFDKELGDLCADEFNLVLDSLDVDVRLAAARAWNRAVIESDAIRRLAQEVDRSLLGDAARAMVQQAPVSVVVRRPFNFRQEDET